jgi:hypothetical protein
LAGNKLNCQGCGQRLQIPFPSAVHPAPAINKTILGTEEPSAFSLVSCPCGQKLSIPVNEHRRCPVCQRLISVFQGGIVRVDTPETPSRSPRILPPFPRDDDPDAPVSDTLESGEYKDCPFCSERVLATAKKCKHCGQLLLTWYTVRPLVIIGMLLMIFGGLAAIFYLNMDTSVEVSSTGFLGERFEVGRVHNIGLMQKQRNGLITSLAVFGLGLVLVLVGRRK